MSPTTLFIFGLVFVFLAKAGFVERFLSALGVAMAPGSASGNGGPNPCSSKTCEQMRQELHAAGYPNWATASCSELARVYAQTCKG